MNRSTLDKLISTTGLIVAITLAAAAGGLFYAYTFIHGQVHDQLSVQQIHFPEAGSQSITNLSAEDAQAVSRYAGQQMTTGAQAEVYANHYIAAHLDNIGGGKTYAQISTASMADPSNEKLAGQVQTMFRGETLRGMLLNAYAFDTMAMVAKVAALGATVASVVLLALAALGFRHAGQVKKKRR